MELILPLIKTYKTHMEQGAYLERLANLLKTDIRYLWEDLKKIKVQKKQEGSKKEAKAYSFNHEEFLIGFISQNPDLYEFVKENLIDNIALDERIEKFYIALKKVYNRQSAIQMEMVKEELDESERKRLDLYHLLIEEHYPDFSKEATQKEVMMLIHAINRKNIDRAQKEIQAKIRLATDEEEKKLLLNQYLQTLKLENKIR